MALIRGVLVIPSDLVLSTAVSAAARLSLMGFILASNMEHVNAQLQDELELLQYLRDQEAAGRLEDGGGGGGQQAAADKSEDWLLKLDEQELLAMADKKI